MSLPNKESWKLVITAGDPRTKIIESLTRNMCDNITDFKVKLDDQQEVISEKHYQMHFVFF